MKLFSLLLLAAIVGGSTYFLNASEPSTPVGKETAQFACGTSTILDTMPPAQIQTSFSTKYPNASNVKWYRYTPAKTVEPGFWYSTLDANDYYVSFNWNDADYIAWYDNENWVYSTTSIDNTEIPANVRNVINTQYPGYIITDVDMERDNKQELYEVKLQKGNERVNIHFNPQGAVVKKKQRNLTPVDVEAAMVSDFESRYPSASTVTWYRYDVDDRVEVLPSDWEYTMDPNDYQVVFTSDGGQYVAYYDNGTWVRSESYTFDRSKLPSAVSNAINTQYSGYSIKDVSREDSKSRIVYEVELTKGSDKCKIHYGADGSIVKKKCRTDGVKTKS